MNTMCTNWFNRVLPHLQSNSCLRGKIDHEAAPVRMLFRVQWTNATHHLYTARITVRHGCFSSLAAAPLPQVQWRWSVREIVAL